MNLLKFLFFDFFFLMGVVYFLVLNWVMLGVVGGMLVLLFVLDLFCLWLCFLLSSLVK